MNDNTHIANIIATENLERLVRNQYPGRGMVLGVDETDLNMVQIYWIMGRSEKSRNRVLGTDGKGSVYTEVADPNKPGDTRLGIYTAMGDNGGHFVVSNGSQTGDVLKNRDGEYGIEIGLADYQYEPDTPIYTPRITGIVSLSTFQYLMELAILRKVPWSDDCERVFFKYDEFPPGFGLCITTYAGDGDPPPPFRGEPLLIHLKGDIETIAETYWNALNEANRVSLAVKMISSGNHSSRVHIINKYAKVPPPLRTAV